MSKHNPNPYGFPTQIRGPEHTKRNTNVKISHEYILNQNGLTKRTRINIDQESHENIPTQHFQY